jgi:single-strand DNA-binding protein
MNMAIIVGRIGTTPGLHYNGEGKAYLTFKVVTNDGWYDHAGEWVSDPQWHNCIIFGQRAEYYSRKLTIGDLVAINGSIAYRQQTTDNGETRYFTNIRVQKLNRLVKSLKHSKNTLTIEDHIDEETKAQIEDAKKRLKNNDDDDVPF